MSTNRTAVDAARSAAIAARIEAYVARRKETDPRYSVRQLGEAAGLATSSQLGSTLARLKRGGSTRADLLAKVAVAMGMTSGELLGEARPADVPPTFAEIPGWDRAVVEAASRYMMRPEGLREIGAWRPAQLPRGMDGTFVASLYRAWEDLQRAT